MPKYPKILRKFELTCLNMKFKSQTFQQFLVQHFTKLQIDNIHEASF